MADDGLSFGDYIQPPDVPCDPVGDDWRGPPGPPGPLPEGAPFLPISGGAVTGPLGVTTTIDVDTGIFGGVANPAQRNAGLDGSNTTTWVGPDMLYYDLYSFAPIYTPPGRPIGIASAVRASDNPSTTSNSANIAVAAYNVSDGSGTYPGFSWGLYASSRVKQYAGNSIGCELSMGNLGPGTVEVNPYLGLGNGGGVGLWLSSGSEAYSQGKTVYPASTAIGVVSNGSTWAKGLVFMHDALTPGSGGTMKAVQLPSKGEIQWTFDSSGGRSSFIRCDGTSSGGGMGISFQETDFVVVDGPTETARFMVSNTGAAKLPTNGLSFGQRQTTTATDVTQHIALYDGWGGFNVSSGSLNIVAVGTQCMQINNTLTTVNTPLRVASTIAFNGATPIAKPTVTGAKGGNAALASLLTALAAYGLVTDSST